MYKHIQRAERQNVIVWERAKQRKREERPSRAKILECEIYFIYITKSDFFPLWQQSSKKRNYFSYLYSHFPYHILFEFLNWKTWKVKQVSFHFFPYFYHCSALFPLTHFRFLSILCLLQCIFHEAQRKNTFRLNWFNWHLSDVTATASVATRKDEIVFTFIWDISFLLCPSQSQQSWNEPLMFL